MPSRSLITARLRACAAALLLGVSLAACSSSGSPPTVPPATSATTTATSTGATTTTALPGKGKPAVVIGDKNYTEQFVLGELYYEALQAQGFTVSLDQNIGPTSVTMKGLQSGQLDMYPEYLNVWNTRVVGNPRHFTTLHRAYGAAQRFALAHGLELLDPTPFSDTAGIAVTVSFAQQNGVQTIRSLSRIPSQLTLGGPPQFQSDPIVGLPALARVYGFIPGAYKTLEIGNQYKALDQGTVQAAYVTTTDGELTTGNYSLLADPKTVFGIGNVVPVVSAKTLDEEGPVFAATINRVSGLLTPSAIRELNALVDLSGQTPAGVASRFLADHGVIPASSATE